MVSFYCHLHEACSSIIFRWREKRGGGACEGSDAGEAPKLTFAHVKGIFTVLFIGCGIGTTLGIIQWLIKIRKSAVMLEVSSGQLILLLNVLFFKLTNLKKI